MGMSSYRVALSGHVINGFDRLEVVKALAALFHSTEQQIEKILQGRETVLTKVYNQQEAVDICDAIRNTGAQCDVRTVSEAEAVDVSPDPPDPDIDAGPASRNEKANSTEQTHEEAAGASFTENDSRASAENGFQDQVARFVEVNTEYYLGQFARFGSPHQPRYAFSWHWPAFFFFYFWALYRKLWIWAAINFIGGLALMASTPSTWLSLLWLSVWPMMANYIYFRHVRNRIQSLSINRGDSSAGRGGVSRGAVWFGGILTCLLFYYGSHYMAERLWEKHGHQVSDVLPGSGSQMRGDGSILTDVGAADSELAKTAFSLSFLATTMKLFTVLDDQVENEQAIKQYISRIENSQLEDSWGTVIQVRAELERYVFVSAGPDRTFSTDDDILQIVSLRPPLELVPS